MTTAAPSSNDISAVIPELKTISIAGKDVIIRAFRLGQLPAVIKAAQPIKSMLAYHKDKPLDLSAVFMAYASDCLNLMQAMSNLPREFIDALELDDGITLFSALLEANVDFFVQRILPTVPKLASQVRDLAARLQATAGQKASSASLPAATA